MNDTPRDNDSTGKLQRVCQGLPPVEVDCSGWDADVSEEQWSTGDVVSGVRSVGPIEVDASTWGAGSDVWLELVVSFDQQTPPAQVIEQTNRLAGLVCRIDPELGLTWDFVRSRTEKDDFIIALAPAKAKSDDRRLEQVLTVARSELARTPAGNRAVARLARAA
jgi:hypothetical protein